MKWISINKELLGEPLYATPNYEDGSQRSVIDYLCGIAELDRTLAETGKPFSAMGMELRMLLYKDVLMFMLVQGTEAMEHFTIDRDKVVKVNASHKQFLPVRKDPAPATVDLLSKIAGMLHTVVATIARLVKGKMNTRLVPGSVFEIVLDSNVNGQNEKIVIACTDKNKEAVEIFCSKILP